MKLLPLSQNPNANVADQCRGLGIGVGDALYQRREGRDGKWYECVLTVIFIGANVTVFDEHQRDYRHQEWYSVGETTEWQPHREQWHLLERGEAWPGK